MKFTDDKVRALCSAQLARFADLAERSNLNGGTASTILGTSRSRYQQLAKNPEDTPMLQAHIFLNLTWANNQLAKGLDDGWLPASGFKGQAQQNVLDKLQELAAQ